MRPSFLSSGLSGTIIFIAIILYTFNINKIKDFSQHIMILLLIGIGFGIHSLSHYNEEIYFDFNPLINKWNVNDTPNRTDINNTT